MILDYAHFISLACWCRMSEEKVVLTSGVFDLFHAGHLHIIEQASRLGSPLLVALNSDESVAQFKPGRPIITAKHRAAIISSLKWHPFVTIFPERTPEKLIEICRPAIFVKGKGWTKAELPETPLVESYGGEVVILDREIESTTAIIDRIRRTK